MKTSKYISPRLNFYKSEELKEYFAKDHIDRSHRRSIPIDKFTLDTSLFVFGEPGFGKSRMLRNLFNKKSAEGLGCAFIDLKLIKKTTLSDYIHEKQNEVDSSNIGKGKFPWFSDAFSLSGDSESILIIDALDEVRSEDIIGCLEEINELQQDCPKLKIILSCRTHHAQRYTSLLLNFDGFSVVQLLPFSRWEIAEFIQKNDPRYVDYEIKDLLQELKPIIGGSSFTHYTGPLATPRYLEYFVMMLEERDISTFSSVTRSELFEYSVPRLLKTEAKTQSTSLDQNDYSRKIPYLIQAFERMALFMEIQRTNVISKLDFASFELDANLSISHQLLLETIYDRTLLKDNGDHLEFDNTEIQEYMAACALQRLGNHEQVIFDLAIEKRFNLIYPGWLNVLGYLLEQKPQVVIPLIEFGCRSDNPKLFSLLEFTPLNLLEPSSTTEIFRQIFTYSFLKQRWLWYELSTQLAKLYSPSEHNEFLIKELDGLEEGLTFRDYYIITFICEILTEYSKLERGDFLVHEKKKWQSILIPYIKVEHDFGTIMHRVLIGFLHNICTIKEFEPHWEKFWNSENDIFNAVVKFFECINPNHQLSIKHFFKAVQVGASFRLDSPLEKVTTEKGFEYFFEELDIASQKPFSINLWQKVDKILNDKILANLSQVLSESLEEKIVTYLLSTLEERRTHEAGIFVPLIKILQDERPGFIVRFTRRVLNTPGLTRWMAHNFGEGIGELIFIEQVDQVIDEIVAHTHGESILVALCYRHANQEVQKKLGQYFPEIINAQETRRQKTELKRKTADNRQYNRNREIYEKLVELLNSKSYYFFEQYLHFATDDIKEMFNDLQKKKIEHLATSFLRKYSPFDADIHITSKDESNASRTVSYNNLYTAYKNCLELVAEKGYPIEEHRSKVLGGVLLHWKAEVVNTLLNTLEPISAEEIEEVGIKFLAQNEDFQLDTIYQLINLLEKVETKFNSFYDFFEAIACNGNCSSHTRLETMRFLNKKRPDTEFLNRILKEVLAETTNIDQLKLLREINRLQVSHNDEAAIKWRIQHVLDHQYKLRRNNRPGLRIRGVGENENLGVPLGAARSASLIDIMLEALKKSFEIVHEDLDYYEYVNNEFWRPITAYFISLDVAPSQYAEIILQLEGLVGFYQKTYPVHFYSSEITKIRRQYLEILSKPISCGEATKQYLRIKQKQYLDLAYPADVFNLVTSAIQNEFTDWVRQGYYQFVGTVRSLKGNHVRREELIQKSMVIQLENFLMRREMRSADINNRPPEIYREVQLLNGKRADLIVSYGLIGAVMIEVKRMGNSDLSFKEQEVYRDETFIPYMKQTNCKFGLFVIFLDKEIYRKRFASTIQRLEKTHSAYSNIKIIGIDCLPPKKKKARLSGRHLK